MPVPHVTRSFVATAVYLKSFCRRCHYNAAVPLSAIDGLPGRLNTIGQVDQWLPSELGCSA